MFINKRIILASASPRRNYLFQKIGFDFEICPSLIQEVVDFQKTPLENAISFSRLKAENIAQNFQDAFIVGADTIVELDNCIIGKPQNKNEAYTILKRLSGYQHSVHTAFTIIDRPSNQLVSDVETTIVTFRELEDEEIKVYIDTQLPLDKAGAYGIQDKYGSLFVKKICGCFYNVVGFPLSKFYITLKKFQDNIKQGIL